MGTEPTLSKTITFRITKDEDDRVNRLAVKADRKVADMIRRLFRLGLKAAERAK